MKKILLITLITLGCSSFQLQIDKSRSFNEQIRWPASYIPEEASFFIHNSIEIDASPETVWSILLEAETWPEWYEGARNVKIQNNDKILKADSAFTWTTMDLDFKSTIREFEPARRLSWESEKKIIQGYHAWLIIPKGKGVILITDESQKGFLTFFEKIFVPKKLHRLHDIWLAKIKEKAERK